MLATNELSMEEFNMHIEELLDKQNTGLGAKDWIVAGVSKKRMLQVPIHLVEDPLIKTLKSYNFRSTGNRKAVRQRTQKKSLIGRRCGV